MNKQTDIFERILVLTPTGNDAENAVYVLRQAALQPVVCADCEDLSRKVVEGAGALLVAEEALNTEHIHCFLEVLSHQPQWSDIPLLIITSARESAKGAQDLLNFFSPKGNVTLIERPLRPISLISALRVALRSRRRQYQVREFLEDQQKTLARIQENERRFRAVFNQQFQFMAILSPEGRVLEINDLPFRATGFRREDTVGKLFWETPFWANLDEMKKAWPERLIQAAQGDAPVLSVDTFETADGQLRIADAAITPVKDEEGNLDFFIVQASDITERKRAEDALRESEERYRTLVSQVRDYAIFTLDLEGRALSWNEGVQRVFGWSKEEFIGENVKRDFTQEDIEKRVPDQELDEAKRNGRAANDRWMRRNDGEIFWASGVTTPLRDGKGKIIGFTKVLRDLTEAKRLEQELQDSRGKLQQYAEELEHRVQERTARLQETVSELEAFSYSVSHDLRAPLRAMQGYSQFLLEDYADKLDGSGRDYVTRIVKASERLDRLVTDILTYSRVARSDLHKTSIDLEKLIHEVIHGYPALQADKADIEIKSPLLHVVGHEGSLTQCISNLLGNAVKFVPEGRKPHIVIWTEQSNGTVRVFFRDNGIGILAEHQERIFRMFEKAPSEKSYEGTGIGLAIVRKAVERMGGHVGLKSAPGQGSTFWIELPHAP